MPLFGDWNRLGNILRLGVRGKLGDTMEEDMDKLAKAFQRRLKNNIRGQLLPLRKLRASTIRRKGHPLRLIDTEEYVDEMVIERKKKLLSIVFRIGPTDKKTRHAPETFQSLAAKLEGGTVHMDPLPHFQPTFNELKNMPEFANLRLMKRLRAMI